MRRMVFEELDLPGTFKIVSDDFHDVRGSVTKTFTEEAFRAHGLPTVFGESFFSLSHRNVIRGMHFQNAPAACGKLVYVPVGALLDVVLDLRAGTPTFGNCISLELSAANHTALYIPEGCAHGFRALEDETCIIYNQTRMRDVACEGGIRYDSFGFDWGTATPVISERDANLPPLADYQSVANGT